MENKITVNTFGASMAQDTGKSKKLCEDFIREFFRVVGETMESGETLKIKGFGTFKVVEVEGRTGVNVNTGEKQDIASYRKVSFTPAKELANEINAPFADFESVEMEEEVPEDIFYEQAEEEEPVNENDVMAGIIEAGSEEEGEDDDITSEAYETLEEEKDEAAKRINEEPEQDKVETITYAHAEAPQEEEEREIVLPVYDDEDGPGSKFGMGFLVGSLSTFAVCVVIFILGCFFDWWPENLMTSRNVVPEPPAVEETIVEPEVAPEAETVQEPVYDTVSTTRYLTTIAREHYGNFNFWPYIYLENESILGHPDRITPGTKVVVPDLKKYGVDPQNKEDVETAKKKGAEIYARYR